MASEVEFIINYKAIIKANNLSEKAFDNIWNYVTSIAHVYSDLYVTAICNNYDIQDTFNNDVQETSDYIDRIIADHMNKYASIGFMDAYNRFTTLLEFVYGIADEFNEYVRRYSEINCDSENYVLAKVTEDILLKVIYLFDIEFTN